MGTKEPHCICTVCGGRLVHESDPFSNNVMLLDCPQGRVYVKDEKEPRIAMICQDCGLRYAKKPGDA